MLQVIGVIHRYLGAVVGVLMTLWCLSGFVVMHQGYPAMTAKTRIAGLEPLNLASCCNAPVSLADDMELSDFHIEMLAGKPVLRLPSAADRPAQVLDLTTGEPRAAISLEDARAAAARFATSHGVHAAPTYRGKVAIDQWTLQTAPDDRPLHHFRIVDQAGTYVYVSAVTGEVVQAVTRWERTLAWLGAIPHQLSPAFLRQDEKLWRQVVIGAAALGLFLTLTGLYAGISRLRSRSPGERLLDWHNFSGLVFGLLTLTWLFSGLMTLQPFGLLKGKGSAVAEEVTGKIRGADIKRILAAAPNLADGRTVQITGAVLGSQPHFLTVTAAGEVLRHDVDGAATPLQESEVRLAMAGQPTAEFTLMEKEDSYYYARHDLVWAPVYRAILADEQKTRLYVDAVTGEILRTADAERRTARWLETALHTMDWPILRGPIRELVLIALLLGVTFVSGTGTWLGFQAIGRHAEAALQRRRRQPAPGKLGRDGA